MPKILSAVACNLDANILAACLPLMEESRVEAIEWSFDALYKVKEVVKRNVDSHVAVEELINLIKESGAWVEHDSTFVARQHLEASL